MGKTYKNYLDMANHDVCICVLTYNNYVDTIECLQSINQLQDNIHRTILIDNGSTDNSIQKIRNEFPDIVILQLKRNLGVPVGFNIGVAYALKKNFKYIFLLNNDTVLTPDTLSNLMSVATEDKKCGLVMPQILNYDQQNHNEMITRKQVWSDGGYYRKFPPGIVQKDNRKNIDFDRARIIEIAPACGILIPINTFNKVGLFDPGYFFFFEDWDFSLRLQKAKFNIWCAPKAKLWHKVSKSTKKNREVYWFTLGNSTMRFYRRHYSLFSSIIQISYRTLRDFFLFGEVNCWKFYFQGLFSNLNKELEDYPKTSDYDLFLKQEVLEIINEI